MGLIELTLSPWIQDPDKIVSTFDEWKWIKAYKKDQNGERKTLMDQGERKYAVYHLAYHVPTGEMYYKDAAATVAMKAFYIFFANPVNVACRILANTIKIPVDIGKVFYNALKDIREKLQESTFEKAFYEAYSDSITTLNEKLRTDVKEIFAAIWYGAGMQISVFFTWAADPFKGRSIVSQIERKWNHNAHYGTDCRLKNMEKIFSNSLESREGRTSFFLALCYQRRGNIHDRLRDMDVNKYEIVEEYDTYADFSQLGTNMEVCFPGYPLLPACLASKC
ncbi:MAG: hypothetical protein Tsb0015_11250 [Simkaniaceae bacterium]